MKSETLFSTIDKTTHSQLKIIRFVIFLVNLVLFSNKYET